MDTAEAGNGDIDVEVACNGQVVPVHRRHLDSFRTRFTFVPTVTMDHTVDVSFNYEKIPGGGDDFFFSIF